MGCSRHDRNHLKHTRHGCYDWNHLRRMRHDRHDQNHLKQMGRGHNDTKSPKIDRTRSL